MTREEAIKNLKMISVAFVEPVTKEQRKLINDTFDMAIQALSQEPCDDAISRQAMLNLIEKGECLSNGAVKKLPSVTQKSGKWIYSDLLRVKHGTMNIDALIDKVYADMREEQTE